MSESGGGASACSSMTKQAMKPSALKRRQSSMKRTVIRRGVSNLRPGKKTHTWNAHRAQLKRIFQERGITCCEFGYGGCWRTRALSFAHAVKRRCLRADAEIGTPEHILTVALACTPCHSFLDERLSRDKMRSVVMDAIARRCWRPGELKAIEHELDENEGRVVLTSK